MEASGLNHLLFNFACFVAQAIYFNGNKKRSAIKKLFILTLMLKNNGLGN